MKHPGISIALAGLVLLAACSDDSGLTTTVDTATPATDTAAPAPQTDPPPIGSSGPVDTTPTAPASDEGVATMVLHNGAIWTGTELSSTATAIAISGETITAVGTDAEIEALIGDDTQVVDLDGRLLIPGLIDAHVHVVGGSTEASKCSLEDQELSLADMAPIIAECLAAEEGAAADEWFQVVSVNPAGLEATAADIDAFISDRPAFFGASDGHVAWTNTVGLRIAGITADTPDPQGGEIERDADGNPTGRLLDGAIGLIAPFIPQPTTEGFATATAEVLGQFSALGITGVRDPSVNSDILAVYELLLAEDALPVRVASSFALQDMSLAPDELVASFEEFTAEHPGTPGRLVTDQVKVFADGVIEAPTWTAAMLEPYLDEQGVATENLGDLYYDPELFGEQVTALHQAGISVHVHAVGDRATKTALDGFEYANANDGGVDLPDQIAHLQVVDPSDYARFADNKVIADFQSYWALRESYTVEALEPFIGPERYSRVYPIRSVLEGGAVLAGGSDWSVTTFNPFPAMQRAVTRRDTKTAEPFVADQAITIEQALTMYTSGSGASMPFPGLGVIAPGNPADIAVLSQNILDIDPYEIENTVSELTIVAGKVVHTAS